MQLPRRLHSGVNSPWSNAFIELTGMSDFLEMWSLPWHTLQRRLAMGVGADVGVQPPRPAAAGSADAGNWLMRALNAAPLQHNSPGQLE
jgi:hypothetical protein